MRSPPSSSSARATVSIAKSSVCSLSSCRWTRQNRPASSLSEPRSREGCVTPAPPLRQAASCRAALPSMSGDGATAGVIGCDDAGHAHVVSRSGASDARNWPSTVTPGAKASCWNSELESMIVVGWTANMQHSSSHERFIATPQRAAANLLRTWTSPGGSQARANAPLRPSLRSRPQPPQSSRVDRRSVLKAALPHARPRRSRSRPSRERTPKHGLLPVLCLSRLAIQQRCGSSILHKFLDRDHGVSHCQQMGIQCRTLAVIYQIFTTTVPDTLEFSFFLGHQ